MYLHYLIQVSGREYTCMELMINVMLLSFLIKSLVRAKHCNHWINACTRQLQLLKWNQYSNYTHLYAYIHSKTLYIPVYSKAVSHTLAQRNLIILNLQIGILKNTNCNNHNQFKINQLWILMAKISILQVQKQPELKN